MKIIDPGHEFELDCLDNPFRKEELRFVKREGENYPGNVGSHSGTTTQEVLRVCISRLLYVGRQIPCNETNIAINLLREAIVVLEMRAKRVKGKELPTLIYHPERYPACLDCGHIFCTEAGHKTMPSKESL